MNVTCSYAHGPETYYVPGSELVAVPHERVNEIPRLRSEFHDLEAKRATLLALNRRII